MSPVTQSALADAPVDTSAKPVNIFRDRGLSVSVFANKATVKDREMTFFNTSTQRSYKDGNEFKTTHSFGKDDLPRAQLLLAQAWQWIVTEEVQAGRRTPSNPAGKPVEEGREKSRLFVSLHPGIWYIRFHRAVVCVRPCAQDR